MIRLGRLEIFKLLTDLNFNSGRCQNSYFEHGIGQESMRKPLVIKREWMNDFAVFRSLFLCISGAPNENIVQNHINIALLNVL